MTGRPISWYPPRSGLAHDLSPTGSAHREGFSTSLGTRPVSWYGQHEVGTSLDASTQSEQVRSATTRPNSTSPSTRSLNQRSRAFEVAKVSIRPGVLWIRRIASAAVVLRVRPSTRLAGRGTNRPRPWPPPSRTLSGLGRHGPDHTGDRRRQETGQPITRSDQGNRPPMVHSPRGINRGAGHGSGAGKFVGGFGSNPWREPETRRPRRRRTGIPLAAVEPSGPGE